ncbi:unnamed protein product, partial [Pylaiella littoralis]
VKPPRCSQATLLVTTAATRKKPSLLDQFRCRRLNSWRASRILFPRRQHGTSFNTRARTTTCGCTPQSNDEEQHHCRTSSSPAGVRVAPRVNSPLWCT